MIEYTPLKEIKVSLQFDNEPIPIGRLASSDHKIYFEYNQNFLSKNLNISPFKLPMEPGVQRFDPFLFEGLPGVFNDSLPDGWGRLLMDRFLKSQHLLPNEFTPLDRLALVGSTGLGALNYEPDHSENSNEDHIDLNMLAEQTKEVLDGESDEVLKELIALNGSSAGARPKALIGVKKTKKEVIHGRHELPDDFDYWLVKFPNTTDGNDAGAIEFVFSLMAKQAGILMTDTYLFPASNSAGYFATKRFDRLESEKFHMHTASGLLHSDFRIPALDYEDLLTLTEALTKDVREVEKMFRIAVFNVLAHNRDDHGKNFSFLMNKDGEWKLAPAYDLTFSSGPRGHQSTMVMGEGQNPTVNHLIKLGSETHLSQKETQNIIAQTKDALSNWEQLAKEYGIKASNSRLVSNKMSL